MTLGFYTAALGRKYEQFIAPYITSTLTTYPDATCELLVLDSERWKQSHRSLCNKLREVFPDRFLIHGVGFPWKKQGLMPHTVRFVTRPHRRESDLLYIGDVDIIVSTPGIVEFHTKAMKQLKLPYSNVIRQGENRLTGLHVVRTADYFRKITPQAMQVAIRHWGKGNDERLLYHMCKRFIGLPKKRVPRPVFGVHASPQRPLFRPDGCHWCIEQHLETHQSLLQSEEWKTLFPLFDPRFKQKMLKVDNWIRANTE